MKRKQLTERMYDDGGQLLLEEPYPFSRLFAAGAALSEPIGSMQVKGG